MNGCLCRSGVQEQIGCRYECVEVSACLDAWRKSAIVDKGGSYGNVTRQAGNLILAVTDTGRGIAAEYRERIFDPAFSCPEMKDEKGTGFGLSFVRSVARFYNGTCTCQSERGKGSTFTITLPLVDAASRRVYETNLS